MIRKNEIKKSNNNDLLVEYINSIVKFHLNYNFGRSLKQLEKHCGDLEKEIIFRGILTEDDIRKVNGKNLV